MSMSSIGDLAYHLMLNSRSTMLSRSMSQLTQELVSGQVSNVRDELDGDITHLLSINRDLMRLEGFDTATSEASNVAGAMQNTLDFIQTTGEDLATALTNVSSSSLNAAALAVTEHAHGALGAVLSALNTTVADRSIFSGNASNRTPMGSAQSMLDALKANIPVQATAEETRTSVEDWFTEPDGFETAFYDGGDQSRNPVQIGAREQVSLPLRADDEIFRNLLVNLALTVLAGDEELDLSASVRASVRADAGHALSATNDDLIGLRAELGYAQARIEEVATRNSAGRSSLEMARSTMVEADPYDTALRLEEIQFQLESLYTVTARNSRLSLLNYIE